MVSITSLQGHHRQLSSQNAVNDGQSNRSSILPAQGLGGIVEIEVGAVVVDCSVIGLSSSLTRLSSSILARKTQIYIHAHTHARTHTNTFRRVSDG